MSRTESSKKVAVVQPPSNIYTILAGVGLAVVLLTLVVVWTRGETLFGGLLSESPKSATVTK